MKKKFKVVMLPAKKSNKEGDIVLNDTKELRSNQVRLAQLNCLTYNSDQPCTNQHLYVVSDEEIKEGDWKYNFLLNKIEKHEGFNEGGNCKKIVATTDKSLEIITVNVDGLGNDLHQLIPQLPESFIKDYIKAYNEGKPITEVYLEVWQIYEDVLEGDDFVLRPAEKKIKTTALNEVIVHINQDKDEKSKYR